ncbi:MAG: aminoglycoside phosphotransferase family protein [bacterium]
MSECVPFGSGHINDTFLVTTNKGRYILQRVNKKVFRIPKLVSNYELLAREIQKYQQQAQRKITPDIYTTKNGVYHYLDDEYYAWRLVEYLSGATTYDISPEPAISYQASKAIGSYQLFLNTLDPADPCDTIKGFHDLPGRLQAFLKTSETCNKNLLNSAQNEISTVNRLAYLEKEVSGALSGLIMRVTHNDTKLNNILFQGEQSYVIDLDTVMRGYIMHDYGDMVRTFTSPAAEDEKELGKTFFRQEHFEALTRGYLENLRHELSDHEKETMLLGVYSIIYEQAIRFLTDFLKGNVYYKVAYPTHNLVRTRTQLKLLEEILEQRSFLEMIIRKNF